MQNSPRPHPRSAFLLTLLLALAWLPLGGAERLEPPSKPPSHATCGSGPRLVLLHDSSRSDGNWARAAEQLAACFEVTLVDVSELDDDRQAVHKLRAVLREMGIEETRIAGSLHAEQLALRYALTYPRTACSFTLPHDPADLELLAQLFTSTPLANS